MSSSAISIFFVRIGGGSFSEYHNLLKMGVQEGRGGKVNDLELSATEQGKFYNSKGEETYPKDWHEGGTITCA